MTPAPYLRLRSYAAKPENRRPSTTRYHLGGLLIFRLLLCLVSPSFNPFENCFRYDLIIPSAWFVSILKLKLEKRFFP